MKPSTRFWSPFFLLLSLCLLFDLSGVAVWWRSQLISWSTSPLKLATSSRYQLNQGLTQLSLLGQAAHQVIVLQNQLAQTKVLQTQVQTLTEENQILRQKLDMPPANRPRLLVTTVISYPEPLIQLPADSPNLIGGVVLGQGALLGFITHTAAGYGEVEVLASAHGRQVLAKTSANVAGVVSFDGKNLTLTAVDRQAKINSGDLVITTGQPGIPPDLIIGNLGKVVSALTAPTQTIIVNPPTSIYQERVVEVLKP